MLRRAALYGVSNSGAEWQKCYSALFSCLEDRFGVGRVWERNPKFYDPQDVAEEVAVAVIMGLRDQGRRYLEHCQRLGIPTLVVDLGWMRRDRGYWQISYGDLNVAPPSAPSDDRFEELGLKVFDTVPPKLNIGTMICGQVPGDAQHDIANEVELLRWARDVARQVRELYPRDRFPKKRLYWRPHPSFMCSIKPLAVQSNPTRAAIEVVKNEYVGSAVVYNSTFGLELLRCGARVVATGPRTVYSDLVSSRVADLDDSHPGLDRVRDLLVRLAYGQYQIDELRDWFTLERVLTLHGVTGDW